MKLIYTVHVEQPFYLLTIGSMYGGSVFVTDVAGGAQTD